MVEGGVEREVMRRREGYCGFFIILFWILRIGKGGLGKRIEEGENFCDK